MALPAEHFDAAPAVLIFMSLYSLITIVPACCVAMTISPSFVSHNQTVWARAFGKLATTVKSAIDVTSCTIHVQTNYSYSFWGHYSSEYEYTIWSTIRHRSEYEANIRYIPTRNVLIKIYNHYYVNWLLDWQSLSNYCSLQGKCSRQYPMHEPVLFRQFARQLMSHTSPSHTSPCIEKLTMKQTRQQNQLRKGKWTVRQNCHQKPPLLMARLHMYSTHAHTHAHTHTHTHAYKKITNLV